MAEGQPKTQISEHYNWPRPNLSALARIPDLLPAGFFGTDQVFRGAVTIAGSPSVQNIFERRSDWEAALSDGIIDTQVALRSGDYLRSLSITTYLGENRLQLGMTVPIDLSEQASALAKSIEELLDLEPWPVPVVRSRGAIDFAAAYRVEKAESSAAFLAKLDALFQRLTPTEISGVRFRRISAPQYGYSCANIEDWKKALAETWTDLSEVNCWFDTREANAVLSWNFNRSEASIDVSSIDREKLRAAVDAIETEFGFAAPVDKGFESAKVGGTRQYFTKAPIDEAWFLRAVALIRRLTKTHAYFSGRVFADSSTYPDVITGDLDVWKTEVTARWNRLQRFVGWQSTADVETNFDCDPRREIVLLQVQARAAGEAGQILQRFESELELEPAPERPYRYRRFMRGYEILSGIENSALADAIDAAIPLAFPQKRPAVADAFLTEDRESADLMPFRSPEEFVERLRQHSKPFLEIKLYLEGSHGTALGIYAASKKNRLELRSNLKREAFMLVSAVFEEKIDLKLTQESAQKKKDPEKTESAASKIIVPLAVGVLASLATVTGAVVGGGVLQEFPERYSLEVKVPTSSPGVSAELANGYLDLAWTFTKKRFWTEETLPSTADVTIFKRGGGEPERLLAQRSPLRKKLDEGIYDIEIAAGKAKPAYVTVVAKK
jgi:hypothetical protein